MIYPTKKEFDVLQQTCNVIPYVKQIEGDLETPIRLFKKLCAKDQKSFLLESVEGGSKWGRYSYIGRNIYGEIRSKDGVTTIVTEKDRQEYKGKSIEILKSYFATMKYPQKTKTGLPEFLGGAVGNAGYDLVRETEELPQENPDELKAYDVHLMLMKEYIVYDHVAQKIFIVYNQYAPNLSYSDGIERLGEIEEEINRALIPKEESKAMMEMAFTSNETVASFSEKVEKAKEHIKKGDIFQVVLSQRWKAKTDLDPFQAYRKLRSVNPSPYLYYMNFGEYSVVGSSPELLVKVSNGVVETCPIAGTRPRGKTEEEDELLAGELLEDEKERAEHLMLLDLARNDIGKVSEFGSVKVTTFMEIHRYSHVMHIVSNVHGKMKKDLGQFDALKACLPAGTLSGAPKVRAMEIIENLEDTRRGIYGGGVGYFGFNGNTDLCITIRTVVFRQGEAVLQAGAGIVADSVGEKEYEECVNKAKALVETLKRAGKESAEK
ncbi:MAG TPA: anthranilate synthase component I [Eubacteriaceae bacterium]|nr:anthranilate synthase component I [Eubacteriaceae bacterium]